ncbi:hypothetical protein ACSBR1_004012 [Camellia fascicularis]
MDRGAWNPVLCRRKVGSQRGDTNEGVLITIFVDNIPDSMDSKGLFNLFQKFGPVKDVFISGKRRKASKSRFGFGSYDCEVAAWVAIQKADGLWCGNKALRQKPRRLSRGDEGRVDNRWVHSKKWKGKGVQKSYAEALLSDDARDRERVVLKAYAERNGWRSESLVVQLSSFLAFKDFREEMRSRGMGDVVAREGGGKLVLLTFPTTHHMQEGKRKLQGWGKQWCESINE